MVKISRETKETKIRVDLKLNGTGKSEVNTGLKFLDHMLGALAKHSSFDLKVTAKSQDGINHHVVEDVGICLGQALDKALGDKKGIERFGSAIIPFDETLAIVAVDLGGRPYPNIDIPFTEFEDSKIEDTAKEDLEHFIESFAINAKMNLYVKVTGKNDHHKVEAAFKGIARSLKAACSKTGKSVPSTKGVL